MLQPIKKILIPSLIVAVVSLGLGGCRSRRHAPPFQTFCTLGDETAAQDSVCCDDAPPELQVNTANAALETRKLLTLCCNRNVPILGPGNSYDPYCEDAFTVEGPFTVAQANAACSQIWSNATEPQQKDALCCSAGSVLSTAGSVAECRGWFRKQVQQNPCPPPPQICGLVWVFDPDAAGSFCSVYQGDITGVGGTGCQTCNYMLVGPDGLPPPNCPQPPERDTVGSMDQAAARVSTAIRAQSDALKLIGGSNLVLLGGSQSATASGPAMKPKLPKVSLARGPSGKSGDSKLNDAGKKNGAGGSPFLAGGGSATKPLDSNGGPESMGVGEEEDDGGFGRGSGSRGRYANYSGSGADSAIGADGIETAANFSRAAGDLTFPEDPEYWARLAKQLSIFQVVSRRYGSESRRWALQDANRAVARSKKKLRKQDGG